MALTLEQAIRYKAMAGELYSAMSAEIDSLERRRRRQVVELGAQPSGVEKATPQEILEYRCRFKKCDAPRVLFSRIGIIKHVRSNHECQGLREAAALTEKWKVRRRRAA